MKGWIIKDKKLQLVDRPMPLLTRETILVDNKIAAICGSDIGTILNFGAVNIYKEGIILGHEFAGAVRQINSLNFKFEFGDNNFSVKRFFAHIADYDAHWSSA